MENKDMAKDQKTILAIDVGNTNVHWCYMKDGNTLSEYKRNKHTELSIIPWEEIKKENYPVVIAGTLTHMNDTVKAIAEDHGIRFLEITIDKQNIIKNTYPTLGIDRVCNLVASLNYFQNLNCPVLVFDFGTATTMTACDHKGNFLGGMITTGCEIELKAMSSKTLSLPHVEIAKEQKISKLSSISKSTEDSILHGVIVSQLALVDYYLKMFKEDVKSEPKVVFTGGNAAIISRFYNKKCDLYNPLLTIKGIYYCYQSILQTTSH